MTHSRRPLGTGPHPVEQQDDAPRRRPRLPAEPDEPSTAETVFPAPAREAGTAPTQGRRPLGQRD
ncbi:MAG: hypothetical protein JO362_20195 [Streptomycetaceae bacterium]|nr:hypothetical protein [Streptomycetaceae bacterium]